MYVYKKIIKKNKKECVHVSEHEKGGVVDIKSLILSKYVRTQAFGPLIKTLPLKNMNL